MIDVRIVLAGGWAALMFTYLLGDVLRIFAGDFTPGEMDGRPASQSMWMAAAVIMLIPILMILLSLMLSHPAIRWVNIAAAIALMVFNLAGLPYPSPYDNFLIVVGLLLNGLIVWKAWGWVSDTVA